MHFGWNAFNIPYWATRGQPDRAATIADGLALKSYPCNPFLVRIGQTLFFFAPWWPNLPPQVPATLAIGFVSKRSYYTGKLVFFCEFLYVAFTGLQGH